MLDGDTTCGRERLTSLGTRFGDCSNLRVVEVAENEAGEELLSIFCSAYELGTGYITYILVFPR